MRIDDLVVLEREELGDKLKTARRELYELRFKHAVGQLENSSQILKVRKDIARILTVLRQRDFGVLAVAAPEAITVEASPEEAKPKRASRAKKVESKEEKS
jgi:large subunit ribosomal protein L29